MKLGSVFASSLAFVNLLADLATAQNIPNIAWGFASSSYQVEGAWNVDDKGPSVWDKWFSDGHSLVRSTGVTSTAAGSPFNTTDHYHRMKSDVALMKDMGVTIYRFSVSWPRILPNCNGQVNPKGIAFYNALIDELLLAGIQPVLTMYHWDTPQACEDQYRSWTSDRIIADFTNYADVLFENYGDRVKLWLTINEPAAYCGRGFGPVNDAWIWPPGHNGPMQAKYDCVGRVSVAHGSVVNLARTKYAKYNMKFSMPLIIAYYIPVDPTDAPGANQHTQSQGDWLWAPLVTGDYPSYLRSFNSPDMEGRYLPTFTAEQKALMRGTLDYLAVNYYSAVYYNEVSKKPSPGLSHPHDAVEWQYTYPSGVRDISRLLSSYYAQMGMTSTAGKAEVMISECGYGSTSEAFETSIANRVNDVDRQNFFAGITSALHDAVLIDQTPITSFIAWSLLDNLE